MNKTVNINLAGIFFHVDEDAYLKLQRYLESIKRSFTDSQGRSEIISDIEARIAELFSERVLHDKQVIGIKEVDEIIAIMGQPEDYLVDDDIFEDDTTSASYKKSTIKKLFRDIDNSYISGVSSGLGHYLGIDAVWMRLLWIILTVASGGTFIVIYILFWILVPAANTTAEKIMMTGEPVNISNIEKKIKDGFNNVADNVSEAAKNVSDTVSGAAKKGSSSIKSSSKNFFDTLAEIITFVFKIIAKLIGIIFIIIGASALVTLIIGLISIGIVDLVHIPGIELVDIANSSNTPIWFVSLLVFFAIGIPFFFVFYIGLKILINNLKSIGNIAKFTLLGLWLLSIITLVIIGIREASEHASNERTIEKQYLPIKTLDTIKIKMGENVLFRNSYKNNGFKVANNTNGNKTIYRQDVTLLVKYTTDTTATIGIEKSADGRNYEKAITRARNIDYNYTLTNNQLVLDTYLSTSSDNKMSDQEVVVTLYLPINSVAYFDKNTKAFLKHYTNNENIVSSKHTNHYLKITENGIICEDCTSEEFEINVKTPNIKIDDNGIEINSDGNILKIDSKGVKAESEAVKVNIDSKGVRVKSEE